MILPCEPRLPIRCPPTEPGRDHERGSVHIGVNTAPECTGNCLLGGLARGVVFFSLDTLAEADIDSGEDVPEGDNGPAMGEARVRTNNDQPRKTTDAKCQARQRRLRGGFCENGRRRLKVALGVMVTYIILQVWRNKPGMEVHAGGGMEGCIGGGMEERTGEDMEGYGGVGMVQHGPGGLEGKGGIGMGGHS